ncbi:MAG: vacuolar protein sorting-associated family 26 protein [Armatimonadota bacterium]
MDIRNDIVRVTQGATPSLEMHLGRSVFATGKQLSGVVLFRVARPTNIRSLVVSVTGCETVTGISLPRSIRKPISFFQREVFLSGGDRPRFRPQRISRFWNEFLGRNAGRVLSAGEHMYPFSIPLPASLPPTYSGKAGKIDYTATARIEFPLGNNMQVSKIIPIAFVPRNQKSPVAMSYPTSDGTVQPGNISINVELLQRSVELGGRITGRFTIANPKRVEINKVVASVENCEWVRGEVQKEMGRSVAQSIVIEPEDSMAGFIEGRFELRVPIDAVPTVEGTAISVLWFLKLYLDTSHPLEFKAPITVCIPQ